jgi:hypothetical protein
LAPVDWLRHGRLRMDEAPRGAPADAGDPSKEGRSAAGRTTSPT